MRKSFYFNLNTMTAQNTKTALDNFRRHLVVISDVFSSNAGGIPQDLVAVEDKLFGHLERLVLQYPHGVRLSFHLEKSTV